MRVTTGISKGRRIYSPPVKNLRLTEEKVRKAIFDILSTRVEDASVLELFAGSGALGIEAISRGARKVTFVDHDKSCIETIKKNIPPELKERGRLYFCDCLKAIDYLARHNERFSLVILDPPYKKGWVVLVLKKLHQCCILLKPSAIVVIEHHRDEVLDEVLLHRFKLISQKKYGDTQVSFLRLSG